MTQTSTVRQPGDFLRVRHLRLLELVDSGGSLAAAARALHLSQPAVTKMLQELETAFGAALVVRGARGGSLTPEGQVALQRLRLGLSQIDLAIAAARSGHGEVPVLRIGFVPLVGVSLLPRALQHFTRSHSHARFFLRESTVQGLLKLLVAGEVDAVIGRPDPDALGVLGDARLTQVRLSSEDLVFACPPTHRLARSRRVDLVALQVQDWIVPPAGSHTRRVFDSVFLSAGLQPPLPLIESMSFNTNLQLAHALGALTLAPLTAVKLYRRMNLAQPVATAQPASSGAVSLMYLEEHSELALMQALAASLCAAAEVT